MVDRLATGVVGGPHGTGGYMRVASLSGEFDHFRSLKLITLIRGTKRIEARIEQVRVTGKGVLIKLENVDTPEAARRYTGFEVWVPRETAAPLADEEYYVADLCGCNLVYQGESVGEIRSICDSGGDVLFEVLRSDGRSVFVPFRAEFIGAVRPAERIVELTQNWVLA